MGGPGGARGLGDYCRARCSPGQTDRGWLGWEEEAPGGLRAPPTLFRPVGCGTCGKTGYMGRFALHEVLKVSEEIERLIVDHGHSGDIKKVAVAQGLTTLRQAGLIRVWAGLMSIGAVVRVVGWPP